MRRPALLLTLALLFPFGMADGAAQPADARRINVLGRATIEAVPDYATVTVGVSTRARTPITALDENSAIVRRLVAFSTRFGVEDRDVQTTAVQVRDVRESGVREVRQATEAERYEASNTVAVRIRNVARLGEYVRNVLDTGVNRVSNVAFGLSNVDQVADNARAAAVEDAARKARRLAEAAGVRLGPVQHINYPPRGEYRGMADGLADLPRRLGVAVAAPIEVGTLEISAEVDVTWVVE